MLDFSSRFLFAVALLGTGASVAQAGTDIKINSDAPGSVQNEIRITQNPTDASNFVVAYNDNAGAATSPLGISYSLNAGVTWTDLQLGTPPHPVLIPPSPDDGISLTFIFDPFVDSDSQGNIYAGYIATDGSSGGPGGIYIERSTNKGQTWSGPDAIDFNVRAAAGPAPNPDPYRFNDRPDMTVDGNDHVYVVWIKDVGQGQPTSDIYFAKSPPPPGPGNTGLDFSGAPAGSIAPKTVNDSPGGMPTPPLSDFANVPDVEVAANGTIYVSWIDVDVTNVNSKPGTLYLDVSTDGGMSFGMDMVAQNITALANHVSTASGLADDARSGSYAAIDSDPANSQIVYMVYAADPLGPDEADIFFTKSLNSGVAWSMPIRVNDVTTNDQIHPMIAVKSDGTIDVAWYDKRLAANDDQWDVFVAKSTDGGASFSTNVRVTDQSFATPTNISGSEPWLGEYLGLEVDGSNAYFAFTSGISDGKGDCYFDSVPNATVSMELKSFTIE